MRQRRAPPAGCLQRALALAVGQAWLELEALLTATGESLAKAYRTAKKGLRELVQASRGAGVCGQSLSETGLCKVASLPATPHSVVTTQAPGPIPAGPPGVATSDPHRLSHQLRDWHARVGGACAGLRECVGRREGHGPAPLGGPRAVGAPIPGAVHHGR